jgi:hypothetical protein
VRAPCGGCSCPLTSSTASSRDWRVRVDAMIGVGRNDADVEVSFAYK